MTNMDDGELIQLLMDADARARPPAPGDLMSGAEHRRTRRIHRRLIVVGGCGAILLAAAIWPARTRTTPRGADLQSQITALDIEDRAATATLNDLLTAERRLAVENRLRQLEARSAEFDEEREATAVALLQSAADSPDSAAAFREVAVNFPDTGAGIVAARQLSGQQ
ncbi:MAG TPA: hypothetical protein VL992_15050 [Tepidisphaeraceae bacterium]|nr:hypothetical protein [Tepidisphaeraceae bacterium]